jgi:hypothetical protein
VYWASHGKRNAVATVSSDSDDGIGVIGFTYWIKMWCW